MKDFLKNLQAIFKKQGLEEKAKNPSAMTAADWDKVAQAYNSEFNADFNTDRSAYLQEQKEQNDKMASEHAALLALINANTEPTPAASQESEEAGEGGETPPTPQQSATEAGTLTVAVQAVIEENRQLRARVLPDNSVQVQGQQLSPNGQGTNATHLFGIAHEMFDMTRRWNRIAANPAVATIEPMGSEIYDSFRAEVQRYSGTVAKRIAFHQANNTLNPKTLAQSNVTLTGNAGLGDQYVILRTDQLIARMMSIPNVFDIFPRRYGIQDREVITNAFFSDFSQAWQGGEVAKGSVELTPEMGYVDDAMVKAFFDSMEQIERQYIGYLNREGSDPIKWSMIEWVMLNVATKLIIEQNERKILGIYVKPQDGKAGHKMNASTGVFYTLLRYYNEAKMALADDSVYGDYGVSGTTMVQTIASLAADFSSKVDRFDYDYECLLNANHRQMWKQGLRDIYGKDTDFTGTNGADVIPDTNISIRWVQNFKQMPIIIFQKPGNIQSLENLPGEMFNLRFEERLGTVWSWARWKEGTSASYVGKKFASKALATANDYELQEVFMNKPVATVANDATTVTIQDGKFRIYSLVGGGATAVALTDLVGAKDGSAYMLEAAGANAQTIAKTGKFDQITEAFAPSQAGDYILLVAIGTGAAQKFYELERCVGGSRTININTQPNTPGNGGRV